MAQKSEETVSAEQAAGLALLKKITDLAGRTSSPTHVAQLAAAYKNVVAPNLADTEVYDVEASIG
jgi:hypothetical protein